MKAKALCFRNRRDIAPENLDAWTDKANETPYYDLTEQDHHVMSFNGLSLLSAISTRFELVKTKEAAGEEVKIKNTQVMDEINALLAKYKAVAA